MNSLICVSNRQWYVVDFDFDCCCGSLLELFLHVWRIDSVDPLFKCFRKDMLFNWTDFWIVLGVLGTIVIIIVILDLCMVGAHSSVSYWSGCSIFSIICDMISKFSVSEIDKNPCLWAIRGSAFHRRHFIMKFSASWSAVINVFKWSFLPFINMILETYKSWNVM